MDFRFCDACDKFFNGLRPYNDHLASEKHKKKVNQENASAMAVDASSITSAPSCSTSDPFIKSRGIGGFYCTLCELPLNSLDQMKSHVMGRKHLKLKTCHPAKDIMAENPKVDLANIKLNDCPKESYNDIKFTFHDICIENVLENVKVFGVDDPIEF